MTSFGWGILFGGFSFALAMALHHSGMGGWIVGAAVLSCAVAMVAIPDRWIRRG